MMIGTRRVPRRTPSRPAIIHIAANERPENLGGPLPEFGAFFAFCQDELGHFGFGDRAPTGRISGWDGLARTTGVVRVGVWRSLTRQPACRGQSGSDGRQGWSGNAGPAEAEA